jgi:hypothetical protein
MPLLALTILSLMLMGSVTSPSLFPDAQKPAPAPQAQPVNLQAEISAPMFHGTVHIIDRAALRVTVQTDFGRLVPVAVESCDIIQWLRIGDRVRLDVDAQGIVRALEKTGAYLTTAPNTPLPSAGPPEHCQGTTT